MGPAIELINSRALCYLQSSYVSSGFSRNTRYGFTVNHAERGLESVGLSAATSKASRLLRHTESTAE